MVFTWIVKLDSKSRLVVPLKAREELEITDRVLIKLEDDCLVLTKAKDEKGRAISKNQEEIRTKKKSNGMGSVEAITSDRGSDNPGANPGPCPRVHQ